MSDDSISLTFLKYPTLLFNKNPNPIISEFVTIGILVTPKRRKKNVRNLSEIRKLFIKEIMKLASRGFVISRDQTNEDA